MSNETYEALEEALKCARQVKAWMESLRDALDCLYDRNGDEDEPSESIETICDDWLYNIDDCVDFEDLCTELEEERE